MWIVYTVNVIWKRSCYGSVKTELNTN
jgi:hypothetical protein